ncbi:hypothetical protein D3C78_1684420 [compost metagenome]
MRNRERLFCTYNSILDFYVFDVNQANRGISPIGRVSELRGLEIVVIVPTRGCGYDQR